MTAMKVRLEFSSEDLTSTSPLWTCRRHSPHGLGRGLLPFHAIVRLVGEYGENQRFRAETDPVLLVAAVLAAGNLVIWRRRGVPSSGVGPTGVDPVD